MRRNAIALVHWAAVVDRRRCFAGVLGQHAGDVIGLKWNRTGEQLVTNAAQTVGVHASVHRPGADLLRRHVLRRADGHAWSGQIVAFALTEGFCRAKVEDLDEVVPLSAAT